MPQWLVMAIATVIVFCVAHYLIKPIPIKAVVYLMSFFLAISTIMSMFLDPTFMIGFVTMGIAVFVIFYYKRRYEARKAQERRERNRRYFNDEEEEEEEEEEE